jgi:hypothetical protein
MPDCVEKVVQYSMADVILLLPPISLRLFVAMEVFIVKHYFFPNPDVEFFNTIAPKETLNKLGWVACVGVEIRRSGGTEGGEDAAAGELFAGGVRRQEKADAARQVFGRDGAGGAVVAAGGAAATALSEG